LAATAPACSPVVRFVLGRLINKQPAGTARWWNVAVQAGARAYLNRQYTTIGIVGVAAGRRFRARLADRRVSQSVRLGMAASSV
jgi:Na+/H+-translocating membrane pyrophosphatase